MGRAFGHLGASTSAAEKKLEKAKTDIYSLATEMMAWARQVPLNCDTGLLFYDRLQRQMYAYVRAYESIPASKRTGITPEQLKTHLDAVMSPFKKHCKKQAAKLLR